MEKLAISANGVAVGEIVYEAQKFRMQYNLDWVKTGFPLSPYIPLNNSGQSQAIEFFLSNLFPEGDQLDVLLRSMQIRKSNVMGVLAEIGQDVAGAVSFGELGAGTDKPRLIDAAEITEKLNSGEAEQILIWDGKYRLNLAGVQLKLNIAIHNQQFFLADGEFSSTHILKFTQPNHQNLVANEYVCMQLAKQIGLNVAEVAYHRFGEHPALLVRRFDRVYLNSLNGVRKLHVIDGCQLLNLPPEYKYELIYGSGNDVQHIRDGASIPKLFDAVNDARIPINAKMNLLDMILFNLIIGNSDAHGKNVSFMMTDAGFEVAPLYDLVSVCFEAKRDKKIDDGLAMAIGDEFNPYQITAYHLIMMADNAGIDRNLVKHRLSDLSQKVVKQARQLSLQDLFKEDLEYSHSLIDFILERTRWFKEQIGEFKPLMESL